MGWYRRAQQINAGDMEAGDWFYINLEENMPKFARSNWYREAKNGMV